jgi:hypothetical protein
VHTRALTAALLAGAAVACGSKHPTTPPPTGVDTVAATPTLSGYLYETFCTGLCQPETRGWYATDTAIVGDNNYTANPSAYRGLITFALPSLPTGAHLAGAALAITPCAISGNPFTTLGTIVADHVVPTAAPDSATFDTTAIATNVATIATDSSLAPLTVSLDSSVAADYATSATTSMYRLRFSTENYDTSDSSKYVAFCPAHLLITYVQ